MQREQLEMALDVFEKACERMDFTLHGLVAFSEIDRDIPEDFDLLQKARDQSRTFGLPRATPTR